MVMVIDNLPTKLTSDILSRLPVKTLSRFKCVSNSWLNLIAHPFFINWHHDRSQKRKPLRLFSTHAYYKETKKNTIHLSSYSGDDGSTLHDKFVLNVVDGGESHILSCDGASLLCCVGVHNISVCNPSTREYFTLPKGSHCEYGCHIGMVGFAYLPLQNEYKLVRLFYKRWDFRTTFAHNDFEIGCEILTLRHGGGFGASWRVLPDQRCPYPICYNYPPFVNESIHWLVNWEYRDLYFDQLDDDEVIVSFNLKDEKFNTVPAPRGCLDLGIFSMSLGELRGLLILVLGCTESERDVWVLKDYENHFWMKEYRIDLTTMDGFDGDNWNTGIPIDIKDGEILINWDLERLDYYNIETKSFRNWRNLDPQKPAQYKIKLQFYWESFFSLGSK